jgi:tRNA uridine 5-carboxymethylaminomethyl modification enzyme
VQGVRLADGSEIAGAAVVVTTGTFLGGVLHTGREQAPGGRVGEAPALGLSEHLRALGFTLRRLKTGTPARLDGRTIDWEDPGLELQPSESPLPRFTLPDEAPPPMLPQVALSPDVDWGGDARAGAGAAARVGDVLGGDHGARAALLPVDRGQGRALRRSRAPSGVPRARGAGHALGVPERVSTSLPAAAQAALMQTIPGLERAVMLRPGYAVEYDAVDARALDHGLGEQGAAGAVLRGADQRDLGVRGGGGARAGGGGERGAGAGGARAAADRPR